jgi:hypothetical protein
LSDSPGVKAILYRVSSRRAPLPKGSGGVSAIATFDSRSFCENGDTVNSVGFEHAFNFDQYAYFVELRIRRDIAVAGDPNVSVSAVRLWEEDED